MYLNNYCVKGGAKNNRVVYVKFQDLASTLGVTKFEVVAFKNWVTLCCAN